MPTKRKKKGDTPVTPDVAETETGEVAEDCPFEVSMEEKVAEADGIEKEGIECQEGETCELKAEEMFPEPTLPTDSHNTINKQSVDGLVRKIIEKEQEEALEGLVTPYDAAEVMGASEDAQEEKVKGAAKRNVKSIGEQREVPKYRMNVNSNAPVPYVPIKSVLGKRSGVFKIREDKPIKN